MTATWEKLQEIQMRIETIKEQKNQEMKEKRKGNLNSDSYNDESPEDFRKIDVSSTIEEIHLKPFLRRNLIEAEFKNADHYLDVHFRLIRGDFFAPLRSGINDYLRRDKNTRNKKIRVIRLYENVIIQEPQYNRLGILYTVQFAMNRLKNVKWEVYRRLIFGSNLCLSSDNFETALFASVANRNPNELKRGRIQVKFEDELELQVILEDELELQVILGKSKLNCVYVMAEEYRHVLKGLQCYNETNWPLQTYIVHVQRHTDTPKFLNQCTKYDFFGMLVKSAKAIYLNQFQKRVRFRDENCETSSYNEVGELQKYVMDMEHWPSATEMDNLKLHFSVDINKLIDLHFLNVRQDVYESLQRLYPSKGEVRQQIAKRELAKLEIMGDEEIRNIRSLWNLSLQDRWRLYRRWIAKYRQAAEIEIARLQIEYETTAKKYNEVINAEKFETLRNNDIIRISTTGAAKYLSALRELGPKIVVVEEADEVLGSHIITFLSPTTEHLILIGGHQQLRPTVTVYQLAEKYHLDVSLFERLIKNGIHFETLELQHRMQPEISRLLVPHIYKNLKDHPSVNRHPHVKGMTKDVFFLTHTNPEETVADSTTRSNIFEAQFLVGLCSYLLQQGYEPNQITILTTYAGQLFALRNLMPRSKFEGVQVTVVDNFQGEENDIILLSFVRSNDDGTIEFCKIDNRVHVALSSAKHGLYCVGNFRFFASRNEFWRRIVSDLERDNSMGNFMTLKCQKHLNETIIGCENDFPKFAPEGGCLNECGDILECGHHCKRVCHVTPHNRCDEVCGKILCELGHTCSLQCYFPCEPCKVPVKKKYIDCDHVLILPCHVDISTKDCHIVDGIFPKCGHKITLKCDIDISNYKCRKIVKRYLPKCNHEKEMYCYEDPKNFVCKVPCDIRLECGHVCPLNCHPLDDVEHENVDCKKKCEKEVCDRGHKCQNLCFQPCSACVILVEKELVCGHKIMYPCSKEIVFATKRKYLSFLPRRLFSKLKHSSDEVQPCQKSCKRMLPCGHACKKICSDPCGNCQEQIVKVLPCGHEVTSLCKTLVSSIICPSPCVKILPCGHKCDNKCGEDCQSKCQHLILKPRSCGHSVEFPCYLRDTSGRKILKYCNHPCGKILPCQHECQGTCYMCREGRVHVPCQNKCGKVQICGHACEFPCATVCPPCNRKCATKCYHSRCARRCGQLCVKCNEGCSWRCEHHQCFKICSEMCERPRCDVPCTLKIRKCGHSCIGLCGEVCPELCRICDKEELTEFVISGYEDEPDARFIQLMDCKHCIEVRALDRWMDMNDDEIQMKECPRCKTTIFQSYRYGNVIKRRLEDVDKVKEKIFGEIKFLREKMNQVRAIIQTGDIKVYFPKQQERIVKLLSGRHALHQNQMVVIENQVNILRVMSAMKCKIDNFEFRKAKDFFEDQIELLLTRLMMNEEKIAVWELKAITKELRRIDLWTNYIETEYYNIDNLLKRKHLIDAYYLLSSHLVLTDQEEAQIRDLLKKASTLSGLDISETERIEIVNAIGLKSGRWYKCPNGHIYVIGECGRANQVSTCNECGASIGGESNRLEEGNAHAGEMDGSRRPTYG